ncbi:MAG: epoxide hydrolase family protein [Rhodanobacter sp.]
MNATPFSIDIPDAAITELHRRLDATRWPVDIGGGTWNSGMPLIVLRDIVDHWRHRFDWRAVERRLNAVPQFTRDIDGQVVHYLHAKGVDADSAPLVLTHGWPGSFVEMIGILPLLTDPENNGLPGFRSFDVVVPSLPGFGFSPAPAESGKSSRSVAQLWHALMRDLGYPRYFAQGGDIGSGVSTWLARLYPDAVRALHLNFISGSYQPSLTAADRTLSAAESEWLVVRARWAEQEGGYSHLQATRPQTLAYALTDSPVGLAAWLLEKFFAWSDGDGALTARFDIDELLANLSVYWYSGNVGATLRMYQENAREPLRFESGERIRVPLSFARFPKEIVNPPREWVERVFDVVRWTEMSAGGHFAALEQPLALARDIHEAFARCR